MIIGISKDMQQTMSSGGTSGGTRNFLSGGPLKKFIVYKLNIKIRLYTKIKLHTLFES
jgi:hypothetical protein